MRLFRDCALAGIHPSPIGQREKPGHTVLFAIIGLAARIFGFDFGFSDYRLRRRLFLDWLGVARFSP